MAQKIHKITIKYKDDEETAALLSEIVGTITAINQKVNSMSQEADALRREVQETQEKVVATEAKVAQVVTFIADLRAQLEGALATGLTPVEVAALAASLDGAQAKLAASDAALDTAMAGGAAQPPADPLDPPAGV